MKRRGGGKKSSSTKSSQSAPTNAHPKRSSKDEEVQKNPIITVDIVTALLAVSSYWKIQNAGYVWDDEIITKEPAVSSPTGLYDLWFGSMQKEIHYWPVVYTSFWFEHLIFGSFQPVPSHIINVILHIANCWLLHRLLLLQNRLSPQTVAWATWIFALHPVHVESVAWIIERKDVLSGFFYLLALLYHPNSYDESKTSVTSTSIPLSLLYYALAMWSKSIVVSLPMTLLLLPWYRTGRLTGRHVQRTIPFFLLGIALTVVDVRQAIQREHVDFGFSIWQRLGIAARAFCFYLQKLIWPTNLAIVYPRWSIQDDTGIFVGCLAACVLMAIACLWAAIRQHPQQRGPLAALLFLGWTLFPVLGLIDYGYMTYSFVADRYQYLASIGPTVAGVAGLLRWSPPAGRKIVLAVLVGLLASQTWRQVDHYRNQESFFRQVIRHNPTASIGYYSLGNEYMRQKRPAEAVAQFEQALAVEPEKTGVMTNYGIALHELGRDEDSIAVLERYLSVEPDKAMQNAKVWNALGNAESRLQRHDKAIEHFLRTLDLDPSYVVGWYNLGNEYLRSRKLPEAQEAYERTLQLEPTHFKAHINLASALIASDQSAEAIPLLERALELYPQNELAEEKLQKARQHATEKKQRENS